MKKKLFTINQIREYFKKQYLTTNKKKQREENNIGSITRTLLGSILIISFFSISPIFVEFTKNTSIASSNYGNNSKNDLKKLLEKKGKNTGSDNVLNNKFLFEDIMMLDEKPTDSVRLSAATIEELFKSTNYTLEDVRKTKLVKPISLTLLPSEIKKIENTKKRKNFLFKLFYH